MGRDIVTRWMPTVAILLVCACMASPAQSAILPTDLEAKVDANYGPVDADERAIWQKLERLEEAIRSSPQRLSAPELDAYTRAVVERLIGRPAPELRIYLVRDASFNAAMFPTGMMLVNTGVLARVRNEAQFAAVLGHEVGHYFRKHSLARFRDIRHKSAMAEVTTSAAHAGSYGWAPGTESWNLITQVIVESVFRFSQDQEFEADAFGLMLMARAGYPPRAASAMCEQLIDERRASAAARNKRYLAGAAALSTHPATKRRIIDLADTADYLAGKGELPRSENRDEWAAVIRPYQALLLQEQINLNDPGASLYLLENLAKDGWTGLLRFNAGEVYRLRSANGDDPKAAAAYAAAVALADTPPEAWRAHGYALLKTGNKAEAYEALNRYLTMKPEAPDSAMIRVALADGQRVTAGESHVARGDMTVKPGSTWKRLSASTNQTRWEEVWTWSGEQIDRITLIGGLPAGKPILFQEKSADQRVPVFRADMTAQDLMSMLEVSYRVNGVTVFNFESIEPVDFVGGPGVRLRYYYASGIGITKRGSCVMRVVDQKLYAMKLEGVAKHFDAVAPEFDRLVASAQLRK
jgi:beta-barrel assembly-enhancing protease